jgi:hypothetical protein
VRALAILLPLACIWLGHSFIRSRIEYLTELYRYTRFYYLQYEKTKK